MEDMGATVMERDLLKLMPSQDTSEEDMDVKTLKNNKRVAADCVFPIDRILSQLVSVAP